MGDLSPLSDPAQTASPPKKRKPLLFKRQAVHRSRPANLVEDLTSADTEDQDDTSNPLALFQRSKDFFPIASAQEEEAQQAEAQHKTPTESHSAKRRKVSEMDEEDIYGVSDREMRRRASLRASRSSKSSEPATPPASRHSDKATPSSGLSHRKSKVAKGKGLASPYSLATPIKQLPPSSPAAPPASITISDDEEDDDYIDPTYRTRSTPRRPRAEQETPPHIEVAELDEEPVDDQLMEDDDIQETVNPEFAEYIIRAQARNAAAQAQETVERSAYHYHGPPDPSSPTGGAGGGAVEYDAIIQIFVTSRLPEGEDIPPLIMKRKLSQNMKLVKSVYAHHLRTKGYPLPEAGEDGGIFLTWKGNKIYSTTSGRSLGLATTERGKLKKANGASIGANEPGFRNGKLHFEAWNEASYQAYLDDREKEKAKSLARLNEDNEDEDVDDAYNGAGELDDVEETKVKVRLTLKSKDYDPVKLTAHHDTTIEIMLGIFRMQNQIPRDRDVSLWWDGEKLESKMTVEESEMEDMDTVEVHVN